MKVTCSTRRSEVLRGAWTVLLLWLIVVDGAYAKDTDIYSVNAKSNAYILMDNSGSMRSGVYEQNVDYGAMYDYLITLNDPSPPSESYIWDTVNDSAANYGTALQSSRRQVYLLGGPVGVTFANADGQTISFTGDPGGWVDWDWDFDNKVDTHTHIDEDGYLYDEDGTRITSGYTCGVTNCPRLTVDGEGHILFDGARLPLDRDRLVNDLVTLYDGSMVDHGVGGLLNAPGYYYSGYEGVDAGSLDPAEDGDETIYFFVTGNWINMQAVYNLHYVASSYAYPDGASEGDSAWQYEVFPLSSTEWSEVPIDATVVVYPESGTYDHDLPGTETLHTITHPGAQQIQVHFSAFDISEVQNVDEDVCVRYEWRRIGWFNWEEVCVEWETDEADWLRLYDENGNLVVSYNNSNLPEDDWSTTINGDTVQFRLSSGAEETGTGFSVDNLRVTYVSGGGYQMQNRMDVAKDAMAYAVEEFSSRMNWGFANFHYDTEYHWLWGSYTVGEGADMRVLLDPQGDEETNREAVLSELATLSPEGGTPLGEALQDVFEHGFYDRQDVLANQLCRKNYIIVMSDGYPSHDDNWSRIDGITFTDSDGDGWTQDPAQYDNPNDDYFDDVANWIYTHSWIDKTEIADPANSYVNATVHNIAFGADMALMEDAAEEGGGEYIAAYNKEQLVAAFSSLSMAMSEAIAYTAPVVSVDAANKIQSGDDLYMGLFMPQNESQWVGNVKRFQFGDGSTDRPEPWMIYDASNNNAIDSSGAFQDNTDGFWGDELDVNDSDSYGVADVKEDGAGEVLAERVETNFTNAVDFYERPIYTYKDGGLVAFTPTNITAADLGVADEHVRNMLVNFIHGYTYAADTDTGNPLGYREWVLGSVVHSSPVVLDYYRLRCTGGDTPETNPHCAADDSLPLDKRFIVVGANDGMLHVFDNDSGEEVFAFIPADILPKLKEVQATNFYETVDGSITIYRRDLAPKYLIFGERRGGGYYWNLDISDIDPLNWTVAWSYTNSEIEQSWSEVHLASIPVGINAANGVKTYKDVLVFTGGYDDEEDNFPEPFVDEDGNGSPFDDAGEIRTSEWDASSSQDYQDNDTYDPYNPAMNEQGRGIFVVDIDDPSQTTSVTLADGSTTATLLPFSVTYGASDVTSGNEQTRTSMRYAFPASPSVISFVDRFTDYTEHGDPIPGFQDRVLQVVYATDIYTNIYKVNYAFEVENTSESETPDWQVTAADWTVRAIFSGNPGSASDSGQLGIGVDTTDQGRKAFYPPVVSWGGSGNFFDEQNFIWPGVVFTDRDKMCSLFMGTGDREHPKYAMIRNRLYSVYDDSSLGAHELLTPSNTIAVSSYPYTENDLLNLSGDELGQDTIITSCYLGDMDGECGGSEEETSSFMKAYLIDLLRDDAYYVSGGDFYLEEGAAHENDAKGWYIVLEDQNTCTHCRYAAALDTSTLDSLDNHVGEKILAKLSLYYNNVYATSYQPAADDECNPDGNGYVYAIDYATGAAALNLNPYNGDSDGRPLLDVTDRYRKHTDIHGIPSGFAVVTRDGHAAALASMGGAVVGPGDGADPGYEIPSPGLGLELYYWREGNSQE